VTTLRSSRAFSVDRLQCRWLSAFDWCRSDPVALESLGQPTRAPVQIFRGTEVVKQPACIPKLPFHPKGFLFSGPSARLLISGSGNLSRNGLTRGVELNTLLEVRNPRSSSERAAWAALEAVGKGFEKLWAAADAYGPLHSGYQAACAAAAAAPPRTDDDWSTAKATTKGYTTLDLVRIRRARSFWIESGHLTQNLGKGNPGNQLMMRALTRVFFGFEAKDIPKMSAIGSVTVRYKGTLTGGLSMEFAHNGMDRLNLPKPGSPGPPVYDQTTLVLEKVASGGRMIFDLRVISAQEQARLEARSRRANMAFVMTGPGRRFGFCP
jgi:hypothetical protein